MVLMGPVVLVELVVLVERAPQGPRGDERLAEIARTCSNFELCIKARAEACLFIVL